MGVVMRQVVIALVSGVIFGAGLALSGMMDPLRVRGFLDILGDWDPTLAFVMGGAMAVMLVAWLVQKGMEKPHAHHSFSLPGTTRIDARLVGGAVVFGIGWGLSGLCPGPGISSLVINPMPALTFVAAMVVGMGLFHIADRISMRE
jgi:uncharacterized membrane protein YedE/YeeE